MTDLKLAAQKALEAARPYVENASQRMYDGTNGTGIREEAKRKLALIDVALSALQHQEEREPDVFDEIRRLCRMGLGQPEKYYAAAVLTRIFGLVVDATPPLLQKEEGDGKDV